MVGARKTAPCGCAAACSHRARKVDAGRPYVLRSVHGPEGATWEAKLRANSVLMVRMCSIRTPDAAGDAPPVQAQKRKRSLPSRQTAAAPDGALFFADVVEGGVHPT